MECGQASAQALPVRVMLQVEMLAAAEVLQDRHMVLRPHKPMDFSPLADDAEGVHLGLRDAGLCWFVSPCCF